VTTKFYRLPVASIDKTTQDCVLITLDVPTELKEIFSFIQGQYLTLKINLAGEEVRRSYSLCSSPIDDKWTVGIKKVQGGKFSTFANEELKVGDFLDLQIVLCKSEGFIGHIEGRIRSLEKHLHGSL